MAYVIPVAAWVFDEKAAAAAINEPTDYFENPKYDRYLGIEALGKLTGAPVESFTDESEDIYYLGLRIEDDWRIEIGPAFLAKAVAIKNQYPHPLVQSATLAVVSQFC